MQGNDWPLGFIEMPSILFPLRFINFLFRQVYSNRLGMDLECEWFECYFSVWFILNDKFSQFQSTLYLQSRKFAIPLVWFRSSLNSVRKCNGFGLQFLRNCFIWDAWTQTFSWQGSYTLTDRLKGTMTYGWKIPRMRNSMIFVQYAFDPR